MTRRKKMYFPQSVEPVAPTYTPPTFVPSPQGSLNAPGAPPQQWHPPMALPDDSEDEVDPQVLSALVERGLLDEETAATLLSDKRGAAMAQAPLPEGVMAGNKYFGGYVAPSPLQFLATGIERFKGLRRQNKAEDALDELLRRKRAYDSTVMKWYSEE